VKVAIVELVGGTDLGRVLGRRTEHYRNGRHKSGSKLASA
jgi:hypothetical protein